MGFPAGASSLPDDVMTHNFFHLEQSQATGNAFNVHVVRHLLRPYASFVHGGTSASAALASGWSRSQLPKETSFEAVLRALRDDTDRDSSPFFRRLRVA